MFWMFAVIGIVLAVTLVISINANTTSNGIFDFLKSSSSSNTQPSVICYDSDGGLNYFVKGTCYENNVTKGTDVCNEEGDECNEYYCVSNKCTAKDMYCVNVNGSNGICSDGACQRPTEITYQGVLNMFNACTILPSSTENYNMSCSEICKEELKTCTAGFLFDFNSTAVYKYRPIPCKQLQHGQTQLLFCTCCSDPGNENAELYRTITLYCPGGCECNSESCVVAGTNHTGGDCQAQACGNYVSYSY